MKQFKTRIYSSWTNSGRMNPSFGWSKNKNYVMHILHQLNWWQAMDCIQLILVERIKIDIAQTSEGLERTISRIGKSEWIYMITKEENSWPNHRKNWKTNKVKGWITGKNLKTNKDTWGNLDTWERRDHELIREYLSDVPVRFGERELKAENG